MKGFAVALFAVALYGFTTSQDDRGPVAQEDFAGEMIVDSGHCVAADGPEYYRIDLVPTRRLSGTAGLRGFADVYFQSSPFGVAITATGHYAYRLNIVVDGLPDRPGSEYTVWITSPELTRIERVGALVDGRLTADVDMNKYLVVVTLEEPGAEAARWQGPVVARGMSRSGLMHTMAGHGPFESEPCAQYGFR